jgi:U3 small nucleolar RNA-associated protein 14
LKKNARKAPKNLPEVDLNEDSDDLASDADSADKPEEDADEEMEDGDAENFFDILEVFDGKADVDDDAPAMRAKENIQVPISGVSDEVSELEEDGMSEDEQEEQDEEEYAISASDREASPEALAELETFLSKLDPAEGKKRKSDDALATQSLLKKRRLIEERTEAGAEGEFGVSTGGESQRAFLSSSVLNLYTCRH